jgi:hypothetical protein
MKKESSVDFGCLRVVSLLPFSEDPQIIFFAVVFGSYFHQLLDLFRFAYHSDVKLVVALVKDCLFQVYVDLRAFDASMP